MEYLTVKSLKRIIAHLPEDTEVLVRTYSVDGVDEVLLTTTHQVDVEHSRTYLVITPEVNLGVL